MGRIKVLFCSFCLDRTPDQSATDHSFSQGIDVSHLATPHVSSSLSVAARSTSEASPALETGSDDNLVHNQAQIPSPSSCAIPPYQSQSDNLNLNNQVPTNADNGSVWQSTYQQQGQSQDAQPSASPQAPSHMNLFNDQRQTPPIDPPLANINQHLQYREQDVQADQQPQQNQHEPVLPYATPSTSNGDKKLSYDIISVREPLAKILAERQQLLFAQQQQRQFLGDHDYIEVYGDRGSSCFYEEIAGSVTSSATYDQIGAVSNHNYQVLINAYAIASRQNAYALMGDNSDNNGNFGESSSQNQNDLQAAQGSSYQENMYDTTTNHSDEPDGMNTNSDHDSARAQEQVDCSAAIVLSDHEQQSPQLSKSIPVYSVINKATRRSNSIMRANTEDDRPPRPPPKNLLVSQHANSAIQNHNEPTTSTRASGSSNAWNQFQAPSTSSYADKQNGLSLGDHHQNIRLPQPPPRTSKRQAFNAAVRPLPSVENNYDTTGNNNNGKTLDRNQACDYDTESLNNGYELLKSNLEDDQIDVGYEKIRESNRYSGGSLSSQFNPMQLLDNGGYESVQPIYSSPSNALVEPNYEAIGPATASELAAVATAKLTAAATVIEQILKQDQ